MRGLLLTQGLVVSEAVHDDWSDAAARMYNSCSLVTGVIRAAQTMGMCNDIVITW